MQRWRRDFTATHSCVRAWGKVRGGAHSIFWAFALFHPSLCWTATPGWQVKNGVSCVKVANSLDTCQNPGHQALFYNVTHQVTVASPWGRQGHAWESHFKSKEIEASRWWCAILRTSRAQKGWTRTRRSGRSESCRSRDLSPHRGLNCTFGGRAGPWKPESGAMEARWENAMCRVLKGPSLCLSVWKELWKDMAQKVCVWFHRPFFELGKFNRHNTKTARVRS